MSRFAGFKEPQKSNIREATKLQPRPSLQPKTSKANLRNLHSEDRYMYHVILT